MSSQKTGRLGEDMAVQYLERNGYKILDRNFEVRFSGIKRGELDIVAQPKIKIIERLRGEKDKPICFVEVKAIKGNGSFLPEDRVDYKKRRTIVRTAEIWLSKNKISLNRQWRIDIIAVNFSQKTQKAKISHFKNAVGAE